MYITTEIISGFILELVDATALQRRLPRELHLMALKILKSVFLACPSGLLLPVQFFPR